MFTFLRVVHTPTAACAHASIQKSADFSSTKSGKGQFIRKRVPKILFQARRAADRSAPEARVALHATLRNTAACRLRESTVPLLHDHNASPNACNSAGIPALVIAAARGHADVVYELLCYGATPELPAHLLAAAGCQGEVDVEIRRLIQCFATAAHESTTSTQNPD